MEWPRDGHTRMRALSTIGPHLCECEGCPGPKLVAKLEEHEALREWWERAANAWLSCQPGGSSEDVARDAGLVPGDMLPWDGPPKLLAFIRQSQAKLEAAEAMAKELEWHVLRWEARHETAETRGRAALAAWDSARSEVA